MIHLDVGEIILAVSAIRLILLYTAYAGSRPYVTGLRARQRNLVHRWVRITHGQVC